MFKACPGPLIASLLDKKSVIMVFTLGKEIGEKVRF